MRIGTVSKLKFGRLLVAVSTISLAAFGGMSAAYAQEATKRFNIPAQPMAKALLDLGRQAGVSISAPSETTRGKRGKAVSGEMTTRQALARLLEGSGLRYEFINGSAVRVFAGAVGNGGTSGSQTASRSGDDRASVRMENAPFLNDSEGHEEILVTGTRIRGAGRGPSPVHSFDREDFAQQGADTAQQVLRTLPQNFTGGASEQAAAVSSARNGGNTNGAYGAGVNLRGLGTESTLILLNGHRLAPGGLGNFVDVSTIPLSALERIEVVTDGASAIYGSDAVGGVVNFILRDDFEGAETQVRYGTVTDGSLRQFSASQLLGVKWSTGSALVNLDYGKHDPLLATERPFAGGLQQGVSYLSPSNERMGLLLNAHQNLTPTLRLSALGYANRRDSDVRTFQQSQRRQHAFEGEARQIGGNVSLDWEVSDSWTLTLAYNEDRNTSHRINNLGASLTLPASRTEVRTRHRVSVAEFEAEGALIALPAGSARLAVGFERRVESLEARRVNTSGTQFPPLKRDVTAGYAELFVPVVGEGNAMPFVQRLNVTLAARYEDYSDVGASDTWKLGALWSPVEGIDLRATWGTSFRAPYLYQYDSSLSAGVIYGPPSIQQGLAVVTGMPHPDLGPETATTWSAGLDVDQDVLGLRLSATYFNVEYQDRIRAPSLVGNPYTNPILGQLLSIPADPEVLAAVQRAVQYFNLSGQPPSAAVGTLDGRTRNQGTWKLSGVDLNLERRLDTAWGRFNAGVNASYLIDYKTSVTKASPLISILDTIYNPTDLRARAHLSWSRGGWSASAFLNYTDSYVDNQLPAAPVKVSSWTTVDLGLGYRFGESAGALRGLSIRANAHNLLDKDPPRILDRGPAYGNPGYDTENANPLGRVVSVTVSKTW